FTPAATEPGMVLGTVGYMSPEQVRGEIVDHRSDLFSFGTILYEILSGQRAFKRNSGIETLSAILKEEPPDVSQFNPAVPPPLERLVRRCLEKEREQRFQSARDLAFNLETLLSLASPGTYSGTTPRPVISHHPPTSTAQTTITPADGHPTASPRSAMTAASPMVHHAPTARVSRPTMTGVARPKRRTSPLLLALLFVVGIAGAAWAGWWL